MHFYLLLHYLLGSPCQFNTESTMIAPCIGLDLFMKSVIRNERINSKLQNILLWWESAEESSQEYIDNACYWSQEGTTSL